jgi:hypothetical protein
VNHTIVNRHGGILNWQYPHPSKWNELHLKLWFRDNGIVYPPYVRIMQHQIGMWWTMSPDIDYLDTIASKARLSGCYARVTESAETVLVDMRPLLKQVQK